LASRPHLMHFFLGSLIFPSTPARGAGPPGVPGLSSTWRTPGPGTSGRRPPRPSICIRSVSSQNSSQKP
jgi:hypothetical protein